MISSKQIGETQKKGKRLRVGVLIEGLLFLDFTPCRFEVRKKDQSYPLLSFSHRNHHNNKLFSFHFIHALFFLCHEMKMIEHHAPSLWVLWWVKNTTNTWICSKDLNPSFFPFSAVKGTDIANLLSWIAIEQGCNLAVLRPFNHSGSWLLGLCY